LHVRCLIGWLFGGIGCDVSPENDAGLKLE